MNYALDTAPLPKVFKRKKKPRIPANVKAQVEAYFSAYKKVYGVKPVDWSYNADTKMIIIGGSDGGCSLMRMRELTRMLNARVE